MSREEWQAVEKFVDQELLAMIEVISQGPNSQVLRKFVEFLYSQEEYFSPEDWQAIREGEAAIERGEYISLQEYEKARGL
mgnify:CR=1 FL=1